MKKLRNIMFVFLLLTAVFFVTIGLLYRHYSSPVGGSSENIKVEISGNGTQIAESLKKADLIRSTTFFKIYLKLYNIPGLKAGKYELNKGMSLKEIVEKLKNGNNFSEDEISLTFQEGINMRAITKIITTNTNNTEEDVYNLLKNEEYLNGLINDYWFITDKIKDSKIYYSLEGYLYPDTYRFTSKDVTVEEIFNKLIKKMDSVLAPFKEEMEKSKYNVHELLTLASIAEMEVTHEYSDDRPKVVRVFMNRLDKGMSLGSDVTTRYSLKLDEKRVLTYNEYNTCNAYNTRCSTFTRLPAGPISTISESSIKAVVNPAEGNYIYFISNIKTGETFFYDNYNGFLAKKNELASVNNGY